MSPKKIILKNGTEIYLRLIEKEDLEGIWNNFNEVVEEKIYLPIYTPVLNQWEKNSWYKDLIQVNNFCIVAVNPKLSSPIKIVGQLTIEHSQWEAAKHVGILGIIVQKKYRNLGLGYHLIELGKEIAKKGTGLAGRYLTWTNLPIQYLHGTGRTDQMHL